MKKIQIILIAVSMLAALFLGIRYFSIMSLEKSVSIEKTTVGVYNKGSKISKEDADTKLELLNERESELGQAKKVTVYILIFVVFILLFSLLWFSGLILKKVE